MAFWQLLAHPRMVAVGWIGGQLSVLCGTSAFHPATLHLPTGLHLFIFCGPQFVALACGSEL